MREKTAQSIAPSKPIMNVTRLQRTAFAVVSLAAATLRQDRGRGHDDARLQIRLAAEVQPSCCWVVRSMCVERAAAGFDPASASPPGSSLSAIGGALYGRPSRWKSRSGENGLEKDPARYLPSSGPGECYVELSSRADTRA